MLRFRTCEFGCKVTNIEIIEKPKFVDKGWEVIGRHALFDCESNSIDLGMANEESVEESVGLEVSQEYSNEVNGAVTVGHSIEFEASPLGVGASKSTSVEMSVGYSHTWTNGKTESTEKTTGSALSTSLDKSIESENGLAGKYYILSEFYKKTEQFLEDYSSFKNLSTYHLLKTPNPMGVLHKN